MEIGVLIPAMQTLEGTLGEFTGYLDTFKPDAVWVPDRILGNIVHPELRSYFGIPEHINLDCWLDPFLTISAMSAMAPYPISFGIAVTDFIRRSPVDLARTAYTMNQQLKGAFNMGFGAGEAENLTPIGYNFNKTPVSTLEQGLQSFQRIFATGEYRSDSLKTVNLGYDSFAGNIWIGGQGNRMLRLTAEYADGWIPAWKMTPLEYQVKSENISSMAIAANRKIPKKAMYCSLLLGKSKRDIYSNLENYPALKLLAISSSGETWSKWGLDHPGGVNSHGMFDVIVRDLPASQLLKIAPSIPTNALDGFHFIGNDEEVLSELAYYKKAGVQQFVASNTSFLVAQNREEQVCSIDMFHRVCREIKRW